MHKDDVSKEEIREQISSFQQMKLQLNLQLALTDFGFSSPTQPQHQLIQSIRQRKDALLIASAGTGKTIGAVISLLQIIDCSIQKCQVIYLCPCREVAQRTLKPITELTEHSQYSVRLITGGTSPRQDHKALRQENIQIAVGTPGRMLDAINRRALRCDYIKLVVIDEADEAIARGFYEQIQEIFENIPCDATVLIASCTTSGIQQLIQKYQLDLLRIVVKRG